MRGVFSSDRGSKVAALLNAPSEMSASGEDTHSTLAVSCATAEPLYRRKLFR